MSLLAELKRRNVIRVAIAYAAVSCLLIQIVETLFPKQLAEIEINPRLPDDLRRNS